MRATLASLTRQVRPPGAAASGSPGEPGRLAALVLARASTRSLGLWKLDRRGLRAAFPELARVAQDCRFADCAHLVESGCAVRAEVAEGGIPRARYDAYRRIHATLDH